MNIEAAVIEKTLSLTDSIFAAMFLLACFAAGWLIRIIIKGADKRDKENRDFIKEQSEIIKTLARATDNFGNSIKEINYRIDSIDDNVKEIRSDIKMVRDHQVRA